VVYSEEHQIIAADGHRSRYCCTMVVARLVAGNDY
jgi:hypothetical protein